MRIAQETMAGLETIESTPIFLVIASIWMIFENWIIGLPFMIFGLLMIVANFREGCEDYRIRQELSNEQ